MSGRRSSESLRAERASAAVNQSRTAATNGSVSKKSGRAANVVFALIAASALAAVIVSEVKKSEARVGSGAVLAMVADTQRELTRMPARFTRLSDADEIKEGKLLAGDAGGESYGEEDAEVAAYVQQVGAALAAKAHRQLPYRMHYWPSLDFDNAFALPGGHVYIGGGLISLMDTEDELAAVLAHEIEHIDRYHCAERLQIERAMRRIPLGQLVELPVEVFEQGYNKDQEAEADREGVKLMVAAGYSPQGAIQIFETMKRLERHPSRRAHNPGEEAASVAMGTLEGYFRSHPLPEERIDNVRAVINSEGWPARPERKLEVAHIFAVRRAQQALVRRDFKLAEKEAQAALAQHPGYVGAYRVMADSAFAQANFAAAAENYRKAVEANNSEEIDSLQRYAVALLAAEGARSAEIFSAWKSTARLQPLTAGEAEIELAGLELVARSPGRAQDFYQHMKADANVPAGRIARLGYWFYRDGDYQRAAELTTIAIERDPNTRSYQQQLGWILIEQKKFESALDRLDRAGWSGTAMALAVLNWRLQRQDTAVYEFEAAARADASWEDPRWVAAQYVPSVVQTIGELRTERDRRKLAKK